MSIRSMSLQQLRRGCEKVKLSVFQVTEQNQMRGFHGRGRGVALFVKDNIAYRTIVMATYCCNDIESLFIRLEYDVIIGVIYRPPSSSITGFLDKLEAIFCVLSGHQNTTLIIVGDVNINTYNVTDSDYGYLLQSYNYQNLIKTPTRITEVSTFLIDHALTNLDTEVTGGVYLEPISNHLPIFAVLDSLKGTMKTKSNIVT